MKVRDQELASVACERCGLKIFPEAAMEAHLERHREFDSGIERQQHSCYRRGRTARRATKTTHERRD